MQSVATIGNATLIAYENFIPIVSTDPWLGDEDDAYFGSWTLSHEIPKKYKKDILDSRYLFFTHGHPDHLNPHSLKKFEGKNLLLPDHVGSRIYDDLCKKNFNIQILPDREWIDLSENIQVMCITTILQDSILLMKQLQDIDPEYARIVHINNKKRLIRAMEIFELTGLPPTEHFNKQKKNNFKLLDLYTICLSLRKDTYQKKIELKYQKL